MALSRLDAVPIIVALLGFLLAALAGYASASLQTSASNVPISWIILGTGLAFASYLYGKLPHWRINTLRGPRPKWLLGNLGEISKAGGLPEAMAQWRRAYGPMYKYYLGRRLVVVVTNVEIVKEITLRKFKVFQDRPRPAFVTKLSTQGLVFSRGAEWSAGRNALLPLFHKGMMHGFLPVMSTACAELLACLKSVPPSVPVDMNELLHKMAMDVIGDVALGVQFGLLRDERRQLEGGYRDGSACTVAQGKAQPAGFKGNGSSINSNIKEAANTKGLTQRTAGKAAQANGQVGGDAGRTVADAGNKGEEEKVDGSTQGGVTGESKKVTDLVFQYQAKQASLTGKQLTSREVYELIMEGMKLSHFGASVSNMLILLCGPMGRALRWLLSHVPGTVDHRFRHIQTYGMRSFVQMCIARKKGVVGADAGISAWVLMPAAMTTAGQGSSSRAQVTSPAITSARGDDASEASDGKVKDAIAFLLSANNKDTKQPFSMERIAGLARELIVAGSDTTANTLAFALYCVSGDAHVEERVVAEVLAPGRGPGEPISHEDLEERFPFVEAVVKEALRMYPPVNAIHREALEDAELGGHAIPRGTIVMVPAMAMNRDPAIHLTPDSFWPDRFLANTKSDYAFQFNPFGVGPRMCLGNRFAMMEAMLVFIRLYQRFSFVRAPPTDAEVPLKLQHTVVTKPKNGVWMYVVPRDLGGLPERSRENDGRGA